MADTQYDKDDIPLDWSESEESSVSDGGREELAVDHENNASGSRKPQKFKLIETIDMGGALETRIMEDMKAFSCASLGVDEPHEWQLSASCKLRMGQDVMVSAPTGAGKSLCFQLMLAKFRDFKKKGFIVVLSPILALIEEQVSFLESNGISAVAVTADELAEDREIWKRVERGHYSAVFTTPEQLLSPSSYFWHKIAPEAKTGTWASRITCFVIDEGHLVWRWGWTLFRKTYLQIGTLRSYFEDVPFLVMSATLSPTVRAYVHKVLDMHRPTILVRRSIARKNLDIHIVPVRDGTGSFSSLDFLVDQLKTQKGQPRPPKTMIFVDQRNTAQAISVYLKDRLSKTLRISAAATSERVYAYHSLQDKESKGHEMKLFKADICYFLVCTDAAGLGMNIPNIEVVIQFRIPDFLDMCDVFQRLGRAARDQNIRGLVLIFVEDKFLIPAGCTGFADSEHNFLLDVDINGGAPEARELLRHIGTLHDRDYYGGKLLRIDPALLWLLNGQGCKMRLILAIFDDIGTYDENHSCRCSECYFGPRTEFNQYLPPNSMREAMLNGNSERRTGNRRPAGSIASLASTTMPPRKRGRPAGQATREKTALGVQGRTRSLISNSPIAEVIKARQDAIDHQRNLVEQFNASNLSYGFDIRRSYRYEDTALCSEEKVEKEFATLKELVENEAFSRHGLQPPHETTQTVSRVNRTKEQREELAKLIEADIHMVVDFIYKQHNIFDLFRLRIHRFFPPADVRALAKKIATKTDGQTVTVTEFVGAFKTPIALNETVFAAEFDFIAHSVKCVIDQFNQNIAATKKARKPRASKGNTNTQQQSGSYDEETMGLISVEIEKIGKEEKLRIRKEHLDADIKKTRLRPRLPFKDTNKGNSEQR